MTSASLTAARLFVVTLTPSSFERLAAFSSWRTVAVTCFGGEKALFEVGAEQDAAQFAGAQNGEMLVRKFGSHGQNIVTEEARVVNKRMRRGFG